MCENKVDFEEYPYFNWGVVIALLSSLLSGFVALCSRKIGRGVDPTTNVFYLGVYMVVCVPFTMILTGDTTV